MIPNYYQVPSWYLADVRYCWQLCTILEWMYLWSCHHSLSQCIAFEYTVVIKCSQTVCQLSKIKSLKGDLDHFCRKKPASVSFCCSKRDSHAAYIFYYYQNYAECCIIFDKPSLAEPKWCRQCCESGSSQEFLFCPLANSQNKHQLTPAE